MSGYPAWVDGEFGDRVDPGDRGLTLGDGVFDTLVAFRKIPFAGEEHLQRLRSQAETIGIRLDAAWVRTGWDAVLGHTSGEPVILRTMVTRGQSGRGLWPQAAMRPTLIIAATAWDPGLLERPARLVTSTVSRDPGSPSSRLKSLGYLDAILAAREAAEQGGDDALLLTPSGRIACTTIANVFVLTGDRLATPPLADAVQPGIMRRLVLAAAKTVGLAAEERSLREADLRAADQVFLTNSVRFLCPCLALDGAELPRRGAVKLLALQEIMRAQALETCGFNPASPFADS